MKWRAYYDDGTYSEDEITKPFQIICIVQPNESLGRDVLNRYSYYIRMDDVWWGLEDELSFGAQIMLNVSKITHAAMGIRTDDANYQAIIKRAKKDPGFLPRSNNDQDPRR